MLILETGDEFSFNTENVRSIENLELQVILPYNEHNKIVHHPKTVYMDFGR